jgi:hypothetical protein
MDMALTSTPVESEEDHLLYGNALVPQPVDDDYMTQWGLIDCRHLVVSVSACVPLHPCCPRYPP